MATTRRRPSLSQLIDETFSQSVPQAAECERAVISCLVSYPETAPRILDLEEDYWTSPVWAAVVRAARALRAEGSAVSLVDLAAKLREAGAVERYPNLLSELSDLYRSSAVKPELLEGWLARLADYRMRRQLLSALLEAARRLPGCSRTEEVAADLIERIRQIRSSADGMANLFHVEQLASKASLGQLLADNRARVLGRMPWSSVARAVDSIASGRMIVVAGRPGSGKTSMMIQLALECAMEGSAVMYLSLEVSPRDLIANAIASLSGLHVADLRRWELDPAEAQLAEKAWRELSSARLAIWHGAPTLGRVEQAARMLRGRSQLDVLVVDYLQLVRTGTRMENRTQELAEITRRLAQLAGELDIAVIVGSQLSRYHVREQKKPGLDDLRDSGTIEEDASQVIILHRLAEGRRPNTLVRIAKNRFGPTMDVHLDFDHPSVRFLDPHGPSLPSILIDVKGSTEEDSLDDVPF